MRPLTLLGLVVLAACPTAAEGPPNPGDAGWSPDAASFPALSAVVYGTHISVERGLVRARCSADGGVGAGCTSPQAVALIFATAPSCPPDTNSYRAVEVYLSRWSPGVYRIGTTDPVTVRFVNKTQPTWRDDRAAATGTLTINECRLEPPVRCVATLEAASQQGDEARGTLVADQTCP